MRRTLIIGVLLGLGAVPLIQARSVVSSQVGQDGLSGIVHAIRGALHV